MIYYYNKINALELRRLSAEKEKNVLVLYVLFHNR